MYKKEMTDRVMDLDAENERLKEKVEDLMVSLTDAVRERHALHGEIARLRSDCERLKTALLNGGVGTA